jgi:hypothetical protein
VDQIPLVETKIDDGRRLARRLIDDGFDVTAAFWLNASEGRWWHLYIASKVVDDRGPADAYRAVQASLAKLPGLSISLAGIKLIGATNPITKDVLKIRKRYTGPDPIRFGGARLGGVNIEEALIYPGDYSDPNKLVVDVVNKIDVVNGHLRATKTTLSIPRHAPQGQPVEWVSDLRIVDDDLIVEKVRIEQGPHGLTAHYREETHPGSSAIKGVTIKRNRPEAS